jgi:hypothetical protein
LNYEELSENQGDSCRDLLHSLISTKTSYHPQQLNELMPGSAPAAALQLTFPGFMQVLLCSLRMATGVDFCLQVQDKNFCSTFNLQPEQKQNKALLLMAPTSSRTCIKPNVMRRPALCT